MKTMKLLALVSLAGVVLLSAACNSAPKVDWTL